MKTSHQCGRSVICDDFCWNTYSNTHVWYVFGDNSIHTDHSIIAYCHSSDYLCSIAQSHTVSYDRIFKSETFSGYVCFMIQSQQYSDCDIAIAAYGSVWVYYNRSVMAYAKTGSDICLPWYLESICHRIVT